MITQDNIEAFQMPEWASGHAGGNYTALHAALPTKDKDWDQKKFTSGPATTPSEATRIKRREERNRKKRAKK